MSQYIGLTLPCCHPAISTPSYIHHHTIQPNSDLMAIVLALHTSRLCQLARYLTCWLIKFKWLISSGYVSDLLVDVNSYLCQMYAKDHAFY